MVSISTGDAICVLDGRYWRNVQRLSTIMSEKGLVRRRLEVEVRFLQAVASSLGHDLTPYASALRGLYTKFSNKAYGEIKLLERRLNHDVKAVEMYLRAKLEELGVSTAIQELVHIALTSEDVNNLAYSLQASEGREILLAEIERIISALDSLSNDQAEAVMLSRTHGQPATPTTFGKEMRVYYDRLLHSPLSLISVKLRGKFNGATGTYASFLVVDPDIDWEEFSRQFVESFGFVFSPVTTQIEPHDSLCELFDAIARTNRIMIDLCQDLWLYISRDLLRLRLVAGEVGSSTMPHKINPIDLENAEKNLGLSNAILRFFSEALPISRLQRDLGDSTVLRNIGLAFGFALQAYSSLLRGLSKTDADQSAMVRELDLHPELLAEAIQTALRAEGVPNGYNLMKEETRGQKVTLDQLYRLIDSLPLSNRRKVYLLQLTPRKYSGNAAKLAHRD